MITKLLTKIFGSKNDRILASLSKTVAVINLLEEEMRGLSDRELGEKSAMFRQRLSHGETLDALLPEAFAVVREASQRVFGLRHFDVQLIGGIILHRGNIAEMRTGEGKTLTATLPAYLNALTGHGVHIVTVNDYLASRDAENNRPLFEFLGISVGINTAELSNEAKRSAYSADITYGTNNEFGFDYLRDNMAFDPDQRVQRSLRYAIVDEVDSILIDEARTPLIISGPAEDSSPLYIKINLLIPQLQSQDREESEEYSGEGHYYVDYKSKQAHLTEKGQLFVEELLIKHGLIQESESLYSGANITLLNHVNVALRAHTLFSRNVDYMVRDGEVLIVDEHTGRTMPGRRWSDGLHQAIEAKEGVSIQNENQTMASITLQNYFRMYQKLSGMTGTADTESFEFRHIYNLDTIVIPTNRPMIRQDFSDSVYLSEKDKFCAIIEEIKECVAADRPVLVGTVSIERSEQLSSDLDLAGISHQVLNAKFHAREAEIIAQAGRPGAVTIATNMAGRGTDIILGGNWLAEIDALDAPSEGQVTEIKKEWQIRHERVIAAGGLHIIGSERHESRRIDNQLRGRSGRQGDPGSSRFFLSMDDTLMRIFASERVIKMMRGLGMKPGEVIEHPWVNRAIARAQKKVENYHFDIRKQLLEFDDVANAQRQAVYAQRNILLDASDITEDIIRLREQVVEQLEERYFPPQSMDEEWDISGLEEKLREDFTLEIPIGSWLAQQSDSSGELIKDYLVQQARSLYEEQENIVGSEVMRGFEKNIVLKSLDSHWKEHLAAMDNLRQGVHLYGYAQKDPKQEYKRRSFEMFEEMRSAFEYAAISTLTRMQRQIPEAIEVVRREYLERAELNYLYSQPDENGQDSTRGQSDDAGLLALAEGKVNRNAICPCGSGKKYKQCHGRL